MLTYYWALLKTCKSYPYSLYFRKMLSHKLCQDLNLSVHTLHVKDIILIATLAYSLFSCNSYIHTLKYMYTAFKIYLNITIHQLFFFAFQIRYSIKNDIFFAFFHIALFVDRIYNFTNPGCTFKN